MEMQPHTPESGWAKRWALNGAKLFYRAPISWLTIYIIPLCALSIWAFVGFILIDGIGIENQTLVGFMTLPIFLTLSSHMVQASLTIAVEVHLNGSDVSYIYLMRRVVEDLKYRYYTAVILTTLITTVVITTLFITFSLLEGIPSSNETELGEEPNTLHIVLQYLKLAAILSTSYLTSGLLTKQLAYLLGGSWQKHAAVQQLLSLNQDCIRIQAIITLFSIATMVTVLVLFPTPISEILMIVGMPYVACVAQVSMVEVWFGPDNKLNDVKLFEEASEPEPEPNPTS